MTTTANVEPLSLTIGQFCRAHNIGRTTLYKLWKLGKGPAFFQVGRTKRIPADEARRWRGESEGTAGGE